MSEKKTDKEGCPEELVLFLWDEACSTMPYGSAFIVDCPKCNRRIIQKIDENTIGLNHKLSAIGKYWKAKNDEIRYLKTNLRFYEFESKIYGENISYYEALEQLDMGEVIISIQNHDFPLFIFKTDYYKEKFAICSHFNSKPIHPFKFEENNKKYRYSCVKRKDFIDYCELKIKDNYMVENWVKKLEALKKHKVVERTN
jgi:hypothetical protein